MIRKYILLIVTSLILCGYTNNNESKTYKTNEFTVQIDGEDLILYQVCNLQGMPLYYYTNINRFPCKSEYVCQMMSLRMYWDVLGNYLQYELYNGQILTKLNHKPFSDKEYLKLHNILNNKSSGLKYCSYTDLTSKQVENQFHVDAVTGATNKALNFDYINGAIKTTYSLWQIAHGDFANKVQELTNEYCRQNPNSSTADFNQLDEIQKLVSLNNIKEQGLVISEKQIINSLNNNNLGVFFASLQFLYQSDSTLKSNNNHLTCYLDEKGFKQVATYNILLKSDNKKLLKNVELDFRTNQNINEKITF